VTDILIEDQTPFLADIDPFWPSLIPIGTSLGTLESFKMSSRGGRPSKLAAAIIATSAALVPAFFSPAPTALLGTRRIDSLEATWVDAAPLLTFFGRIHGAGVSAVLPNRGVFLPASEPNLTNSGRALAAARDLTSWLNITEEQLAEIAGFSRRNYVNWRDGRGSYSKTIRGLFELHALASGLRKMLGQDGFSAWLSMNSGGIPRRELLSSSSGRSQLLAEAEPLMFAKRDRQPLIAEFEDAEPAATRVGSSDELRSIPPRRRPIPE
jgi:hypothetical protein